MTLRLEPITVDEDKMKEPYASPDCQTLLKMWEAFYPGIVFNFPWVGYFVKRGDEIVGSCAFIGQPENNSVEVSYWTFKEFEGQGIAKFSCKQLILIARTVDPTLVIKAKTAPEHNASTKILEQNGFMFSGIVQDHGIGEAWEWILKD